jgi:phage tail tape-measure protein
VGAAVTAWGGGFGALPGAIIGAAQGFSTGVSIGLGVGIGVGGILGGQLGFLSSKQNHKIYRENKLTEEMNNAVND